MYELICSYCLLLTASWQYCYQTLNLTRF